MNLIGYVRVSTDSQRENTSLEEQRRRIDAYCTAYGHNLVEVFVEVASAKDTTNRPHFLAAIQAVKNADGLIACKLDRIARNTKDVLTLVEDVLQPEDKALVLLDLNVDTSSPTGRMILTVMASVAQLERDIIKERTQSGRKAKKEKGGFAYGSPPYGYDAQDGQLVPNDKEQSVIEQILVLKGQEMSLRAIAEVLNTEGYTTKRGKQWQAKQIKEILDRLSQPILYSN
jgi:site-specific DNA recombinase